MVSKNNLCSYSLYSLYGQLNELWVFVQGVIRVKPLNQSIPLNATHHSERSVHSKHSKPS